MSLRFRRMMPGKQVLGWFLRTVLQGIRSGYWPPSGALCLRLASPELAG